MLFVSGRHPMNAAIIAAMLLCSVTGAVDAAVVSPRTPIATIAANTSSNSSDVTKNASAPDLPSHHSSRKSIISAYRLAAFCNLFVGFMILVLAIFKGLRR